MDIIRADRRTTEGDDLIEHRLGIPQGSIGPSCDGIRRGRVESDFLTPGNEKQMARNELRSQSAKVKTLAAAQDSRGHLLRLGRGKEKLHMLRRFFERFQ